MKYIDFDTWRRKEHYKFFSGADYPQFNICMNIDITNFLVFVKAKKISFYYGMIYASTFVMNEMEDFRYKIRDGKIILHDTLKPSFIDMDQEDTLFKIVTLDLEEDIITFSNTAKKKSEEQKEYFPKLNEIEDDLIYYSCIPWISFTHISNEITINKEDSIPRISWGKYFRNDDKVLLPYSIQVNHSLLDGIHVGKFIQRLQKYLDSFQD